MCAGHRPVSAWFLKIVFVKTFVCLCVYICMCMCLHPRLLITSGMMWCNIDPYNYEFYGFYMTAVVSIVSGRGLSFHTHHGKPKKSKLVLYKTLHHCNSHLN